ncbi:unnamed protein product [Sphacelaria rigidula]
MGAFHPYIIDYSDDGDDGEDSGGDGEGNGDDSELGGQSGAEGEDAADIRTSPPHSPRDG